MIHPSCGIPQENASLPALPSTGIANRLFPEKVVQLFHGIFFLIMGRGPFFFPEDEEVTKIGPVP
jgi:hypothetical protein